MMGFAEGFPTSPPISRPAPRHSRNTPQFGSQTDMGAGSPKPGPGSGSGSGSSGSYLAVPEGNQSTEIRCFKRKKNAINV